MAGKESKGEAVTKTRVAESILAADVSDVADVYANFTSANVTPLDFNLMFGRAALPVNSPPGIEVALISNLKYSLRVTMPVVLLPQLHRLLGDQLKVARERGILQAEPETNPGPKAR